MLSLESLQRLAIPNVVCFEQGPGDLARAMITTPHASATVYTHGAHVAEYRHPGQPPLLFLSGKSTYQHDKPIRGGVPVIFPWFGPRTGHPESPIHGFARVVDWSVESIRQQPDQSVELILALTDDAVTRKIWPVSFALRYRVTIGETLAMALEVHNTSAQPFTFEEALHTYFAVSDVRKTSVTGLAGATYLDKMDGMKRKKGGQDPLRFVGETDQLYLNTKSVCILDDPGLNRRIVVEKTGSDSTVVWNPWIAKAKAMPDFGDDEWPTMLCIETVNAADNAITLAPGQKHEMRATIKAERR